MKIVLVGGGEAGLHLLSGLSADPAVRIPLVVEPDREALIYRVETLGFRWSDTVAGGHPPVLKENVEAVAEAAEPDLIISSIDDEATLARLRAAAPVGVPVLTPEDLALCERLRRGILSDAVHSGWEEAQNELGVGREQLDDLLERLQQGASWSGLLERVTWFVQWLCGAPMGALFVYRGWGRQLLFERERGMAACGTGERLLFRGAAQQAVDEQRVIQVCGQVGGRDRAGAEIEIVALPLLLDDRPVGALAVIMPARPHDPARRRLFVLSWLAIPLAGLLSRGMQMEWMRESALRDRIRRGIKELIGRDLSATEACRQGVGLIADGLAAASCRLYHRGPRAAGWAAVASAPPGAAPAQDPWQGTIMLTTASLEPLLLVQRPSALAGWTSAGGGSRLLYLPFSLGAQGDGVLVVEHHDAESWSVQLVELLKEMGQLLGSVAQRAEGRA